MHKIIKKAFSSEFGKGTLVLFVTINLFYFLNFVFHFLMGRALGPANYGILAVLMSIIYIFAIPSEAIQNIISRYTMRFSLKKEKGKIKYLMLRSLRKSFKLAFLMFLLATFLAVFLSRFLKINFWLILLTNLYLFVAFSIPVVRGVLQGQKKFALLGSSMVVESALKLIFSVSLVLFGFKVFGAMTGVVLGVFSSLLLTIYFNREVISSKEQKVYFNKIYMRSIPYFVSMFVILVMFSLDILLAKRFFSPEIAGKYSVLSMLGKIIFFGTTAVNKAMFPLTVEKHESNENPRRIFYKSLLIVAFLCIFATLLYAVIPKFIILILYGGQYIDMAPFLLYSALALSFLSLANLVLIYGLSINALRNSYVLFTFLIIEILLFYLFHSTILEYVLAFMASNIIIFLFSLLLVSRWSRK